MAKQAAPLAPSKKIIKAGCDSRVYERGCAIAEAHDLKGLSRAGDELFGRCIGSYGDPYQLHARLENGGVAESSCSCPFDGDGWCKHLVALLLRYGASPADFGVMPSLSAMIGAMERDDLNGWVETVVRREPQLLASLAQTQAARARPDATDGRLRVTLRNALTGNGADDGRVALETAVNRATQLEAKEDWAGASEIWRVVVEEIVAAQPHWHEIAQQQEEDDYGDRWYEDSDEIDFGEAWSDQAVAGLERCLNVKTLAPGLRNALLHSLWQAWLDSENSDFFLLSEEAINRVIEDADAAFWGQVEAELLKRVEAGGSYQPHLSREHLLDLLAYGWERRDQSARATAMLRQHGSYRQQLDLLMEERDFEAAHALALRNESAQQPGLLTVAESMESAGEHERAEKLALRAQELMAPHQMPTPVEWLARFYLRRKRFDDAQNQSAKLFVRRPDAASLKLWKQSMGDDWNERYAQLEQAPAMTPPLPLQLAILDARAARALELFGALDNQEKARFAGEVARVCASDFPDEAIKLYRQMGEAHIEQRHYGDARTVYKSVAQIWKQAREIHKKQGTMNDWAAYIGAQREAHKRLPALMDELKKAGL